jgi:chromosome segregation protein
MLVHGEAEKAQKYADIKNRFDARSLDYTRVLSESETLRTNVNQMQREAKELGVDFSANAINAGLDERRSTMKILESSLATLQSFAALDQIAEMESRRAVLQKEADVCTTEIDLDQRAFQNAHAIASIAKRIAREVLEERLAALNPLLTELYIRLRPHVDYSEVSYRMRGDVRRFLRLEVGDELNPRFTFSSGQRRALGLAFLLAVHLSRPWCKLKTLVLDDPIQHIDDYRALHLVEALASVRQLGQQVICTTEDPALADLLCRRLRTSIASAGIRVELDYEPGAGIQRTRVEELAPFPERVLLMA